MATARQRIIGISDATGVAEARRAVADLATLAQFDEAVKGELALAVTEAGSNVFKHARAGSIAARIIQRGTAFGVEVMAIDKGPGIADLDLAMQDGYTSGGGLGLGLPGARRLVDEFDIETAPSAGTTVTLVKWSRAR